MKKIGIIAFSLLAPALFASEKPLDLRVCENLKNPVGYTLDTPSFSWKLPSGAQTAYRVQVVSDPEHFALTDVDLGRIAIWDSGKVESSRSVNVPFFRKMASQERLYWRVKYWGESGDESEWSQVAFFEAGLEEGLDGKWISSPYKPKITMPTLRVNGKIMNKPPKTQVRPTYFRREFSLPKEVKRARMYVASLGFFQAYLNGEKVGDDFLGTGWTDYHARVQTNAYDITDSLRKGANAVGALLGDGWYAGTIGWRHKGVYGDIPAIKIYIDVEFVDGTTFSLKTDGDWKASYGAVQSADIYMGEKCDLNFEMRGWNAPKFDDSLWAKAAVDLVSPPKEENPRRNTPIRAMNVLKPISVKKIAEGAYIFDFGQNMVGFPRARLKAPKGAKITLRYAEMLNPDGTLYTENYRFAASRDEIVSAGGKFEWTPLLTFHGFRYVEVSGLKYAPGLDALEGVVLHNDMAPTGGFECSNEDVNKLQRCIIWGQKSNFVSVPTDCPQRDERLGWTGDATAFAPTAAFNMDVAAFYAKWSLDMRDAQRRDGNMPFICPDILGGINGGPCWGDAIVVIPYETYLAFGDKKILADNYAAMKKWVDYQLSTAKDFIRPEIGFGDWLQPNAKKMTGDTPKSLIATAYFAYTAGVVAECAKLLGKKEDAASYAKLSEDVKKAFNARFVKPDGLVESDAQTAYALPLNLGVILPEMREKVFAKFVEKMERDNFTLSTGFVGTPHLNLALSKFGRSDIAYKLLLNKNYPSWLYPITQGATTMWERWNSYTHETGFGDANMNSFNHYAYGAVGQWLYKDVGGLWHAAPGYSKILFAPSPTRSLSSASVWHETPYGTASSSWTLEGDNFDWTIKIPPNSEGIVICKTELPDTVLVGGNPPQNASKTPEGYPTFTLKSGTHKISFKIK